MNKDEPVKKDIVYIDVEDDVTSVIGKVRSSTEKIVALVPPKNIGTLQSAVNLRLLQKAADGAGKRIVLITNNPGLTALAAGVKMPVAKNLQTKPEIPTVARLSADTSEDVIDGDAIPVGELAAAAETTAASTVPAVTPIAAPSAKITPASDDDIIIDDVELPDLTTPAVVGTAAVASKAATKKGGPRVPNFNRFRKWIFLGGGALVAIILFFVLTNIFLSGASVVITAQTSDQPVDLAVTLSNDATTNPDSATLHSETKTLKKTASVDFTPTGKKNVGEKATGSVKYSNSSANSVTIAAGASLTSSSGLQFLTNSSVTIPGATLSFSCANYICPGTATGSVTAAQAGSQYNGASGSLDGTPSGVSATLSDATSGGTDKTATVVSDDDISQATAKLSSSDADSAKSQLTSQFGSDYVVISDSFTTQTANPVSSPASGSEATTAKLTRDSTYTLTAVKKSEIKTLTTNAINTKTQTGNQRIYNDGSSSAAITQFITSPSGVETARVSATGKVGPNIDDNALKAQIVGKKSGEIVDYIKSNNSGVRDVQVSLSPFWRTTAPSADKIKISFDLKNG